VPGYHQKKFAVPEGYPEPTYTFYRPVPEGCEKEKPGD
jgi:hypothetical protein